MFLYLLPFLVGILLLANRSAARLDHLVVLSHGIHGLKTDLTYLAQQLRSAGCVVLVSSSNEFLRSQSGIEIGGKNLAQEILTVRNSNPQLKRISIVGNSLGGLYTRYVTKELYDTNSGLIAGLHPHCFLVRLCLCSSVYYL